MWPQCCLCKNELSVLVDHKLKRRRENEEMATALTLQLPDGAQNREPSRTREQVTAWKSALAICIVYTGSTKH